MHALQFKLIIYYVALHFDWQATNPAERDSYPLLKEATPHLSEIALFHRCETCHISCSLHSLQQLHILYCFSIVAKKSCYTGHASSAQSWKIPIKPSRLSDRQVYECETVPKTATCVTDCFEKILLPAIHYCHTHLLKKDHSWPEGSVKISFVSIWKSPTTTDEADGRFIREKHKHL